MSKIPRFLAHLPIWKFHQEDTERYKAERVKEHKYDVLEPRNKKQNTNPTAKGKPKNGPKMVEKICPVCGNTFLVQYKYRNKRIVCGRSCGAKRIHISLGTTDWITKAIQLRKEGMKYEAIANEVGRATSTVWKELKNKGF